MRVLFVHRSFPGQFIHLARRLAQASDNDVRAIGDKDAEELAGVALARYAIASDDVQSRALAVEATAEQLRASGFYPDVIMAHPFWGEAVYVKDVYPDAKLLLYCEWFHTAPTFHDPEVDGLAALGDAALRTAHNARLIASLEAADHGVSPTEWQRSQFPERFRKSISCVHDGIDTDRIQPSQRVTESLTFSARWLDPVRGFHVFMRALPEIQRWRSGVHTFIVGGVEGSYADATSETHASRLLRELGDKLDVSRITFCGTMPYARYLSALRQSKVHVYLTFPFVLSWSLLEAMSAGCLIVGSKTAPVEEVVRDQENGLLVDYPSPEALAAKVIEALSMDQRPIRAAARRTVVERYDLKRVCLPAQISLLDRLIA